jgi:gamma-glutamyltranspeptidase/glutathione hydrolase
MAAWRATRERPVSLDYRGYSVHKPGPWSQGPACLQELDILKHFDLDAMDPCGADFIHTLTETAKLALADRDIFYGDPEGADVPLDRLLSDSYSAERAALVGREASLELRPGNIGDSLRRLERLVAQAGRDHPADIDCGEPVYHELPPEPADTCYLNATDRWGNMVSATPSGGWLQGSPAVPGLGFCVTTRGQMFWLDEGLPTTLSPGMRPRTTLSPTLVTRDGEAHLVYGAPGGDQQGQWPLFAFLRHVHGRLPLQAAIEAPNFHCDHFPQSFYPRELRLGLLVVENRLAAGEVETLRRRGHEVVLAEPWSLGRVCMIARRGGMIEAAASPRMVQAYAIAR